jgi:CRISPR-associated endoribonuclease Cas6
MKFRIKKRREEGFNIPVSFNEIIQSFCFNKRVSKFFTLSKLLIIFRLQRASFLSGYLNFFLRGFTKGWMDRYRLTGAPELLRLAYDAVLGSKNSQGFGCFEVVRR